MTCEEFERALPEIDGGHSLEHESHLVRCSACSGLIADLNAISQQARLLQETDEPDARVWTSIEIALRQEGLIHEPKLQPFLLPVRPRRWRLAWSIPVAVAILLMFGVLQYKRASEPASSQIAQNPSGAVSPPVSNDDPADDQHLLEVVSQRSPAMLASYRADLRDVNSYIRDAKETVAINPNDEQAQKYLMDAYEQRSMVYEMALDRSLP